MFFVVFLYRCVLFVSYISYCVLYFELVVMGLPTQLQFEGREINIYCHDNGAYDKYHQ